MLKGFVYILRLKNNKLYVGSTVNICLRLKQHKAGYVTATRYLNPVKLEFYQQYNSFQKAHQIESRLKRLKRKDYLEKIIQDKVIKLGL